MKRSRLIKLAAVAGLTAPLLAGVPAASAAPPYREEIVEPFSNLIDNYCGVTGLSVVDAGTFRSSLQVQTRNSGLEYFLEHIRVSETVTNAADPAGPAVRIETAFIQKDLKLTQGADGTFTILQLLTGPSTAYGPDGKAIARDPGQIRFKIVIAADGTETVTVDKPSTGRSDDYCEAIVGVIG
jgi:hypothetical protein